MKLIVAIDGKQSADTALEHILKANYKPDTQIHLVHVLVPEFADVQTAGIPNIAEDERKEEEKILQDMALAIKNKLGITATTEILTGEVAPVIADVCKKLGADEVIVPSHARHGFSRLWFGSVADEIVDESPCTVVVLKMQQSSKS